MLLHLKTDKEATLTQSIEPGKKCLEEEQKTSTNWQQSSQSVKNIINDSRRVYFVDKIKLEICRWTSRFLSGIHVPIDKQIVSLF